MTCDVSANMTAYTGYTIGTSGTITVDQYNIYLADAIDEFTNYLDPGCNATTACRIKAYLVADYIAAFKGDDAAYKSEKIGDYSYTISDIIAKSGRSKWYALALMSISGAYKGKPVDLTQYTDGITRNDSEYYDDLYQLDQNIIPDLNNEYS
jgi:hypothetical protein